MSPAAVERPAPAPTTTASGSSRARARRPICVSVSPSRGAATRLPKLNMSHSLSSAIWPHRSSCNDGREERTFRCPGHRAVTRPVGQRARAKSGPSCYGASAKAIPADGSVAQSSFVESRACVTRCRRETTFFSPEVSAGAYRIPPVGAGRHFSYPNCRFAPTDGTRGQHGGHAHPGVHGELAHVARRHDARVGYREVPTAL